MSNNPDEFWKLDLTKLTPTGWLLIVVSIVTTVVVMLLVLALFSALGFKPDSLDNRNNKLLGLACFIPGIAAGVGVFAGGRRLCERSRRSILRP